MHFQEFKVDCILIKISLMFVASGQAESKSALVQLMVWCQTSDKKLIEPMMTQFTDTYVC